MLYQAIKPLLSCKIFISAIINKGFRKFYLIQGPVVSVWQIQHTDMVGSAVNMTKYQTHVVRLLNIYYRLDYIKILRD